MKKIKYITLLLASLLVWTACSRHDEKDLFDDSAANRITKELEKYAEILTDAPNGWLMQFYAGENSAKVGGFNILCSFKDGTATLSTDLLALDFIGLSTEGDDQYVKINSQYSLISDQGPVLTFNTYNAILHYFAEPQNSPTTFKGDYEFIIMEANENCIQLKGKKRGNRISLCRLQAGESWEQFIDETNQVINNSVHYSLFDVTADGALISTVAVDDNRTFTFNSPDGTKLDSQNAIYTPGGIRFYEAIDLNGKKAQNFSWDEASKSFICTDGGVEMILKGKLPEDYLAYDQFPGSYRFYYGSNSSKNASIVEGVRGKTLIIKDAFPFDVVATYSRTKGKIQITTQDIGLHNGYTVSLCPWDSNAGYLTWSSGIGVNSVLNTDSPNIEFTFEDNGVWGSYKAQSFLIVLFDGSTRVGYYPGTYQFYNMKFTKQ